MWLVYLDYEYHRTIDEHSRLFHSKKEAKIYAKRMNRKLAKLNDCRVRDMADCYAVIFIPAVT